MTETEWAAYVAAAQVRINRLRARLDAGEGEADAAHTEGFATRNDINARVAAVADARRGGE